MRFIFQGHYHPFLPSEGSAHVHLSPRPAIALKRPVTEIQPPPELMSFIQRQEDYIEQLEKESQYCRVSVLLELSSYVHFTVIVEL